MMRANQIHNLISQFRPISLTLFLLISFFSVYSQNQTKLTAFDRDTNDQFGSSVALWKNTVIVGAPREGDSIPTTSTKLAPLGAGAVYIFTKNTRNEWQHLQKITADSGKAGDLFGESVDLSDRFLVVGAPLFDVGKNGTDTIENAGAVYVFEKDNQGSWVQKHRLIANTPGRAALFGSEVHLSNDLLFVGAPAEAWNKSRSDSLWNAGAVYVYKHSAANTWDEVSVITPDKRVEGSAFGTSISASGDWVAIGAPVEDIKKNDGSYHITEGAVYMFNMDSTGTGVQAQRMEPLLGESESDYFGSDVAVSGNYAAVAAFNDRDDQVGKNPIVAAGSVYILEYDVTTGWQKKQKLILSDRKPFEYFGKSISLLGTNLLVGATSSGPHGPETDSSDHGGASYLFTRNLDGIWRESTKFVPTDQAEGDWGGNAVDLDTNYFVMGAVFHDFDSSGKSAMLSAGAAYLHSVDLHLGVDQPANLDLSAFPNPTTGMVTVNLGKIRHKVCVELFNECGQLVSTFKFGNTSTIRMNLPDHSQGLFLLQVTIDGTEVHHVKVIKL